MAKEIGYLFLDVDHEVEKTEGRSIAKIFEIEGEGYFRKLELKILRQMTMDNVVVSTGGGVPCFNDNMDWMNNSGFTIFLNPPLDMVISRVANQAHRPLVGNSPEESIKNLHEKRITIYKQAGMESYNSEPNEVTAELLNFFSSESKVRS